MDNEIFLNTRTVIELENVSYNTILKRIQRGKIKALKVEVNKKQGFEYCIPLSELSYQAQQKYFAKMNLKAEAKPLQVQDKTAKLYENLTLKDLSEAQRQEVHFWKQVLKKWNKIHAEHPEAVTKYAR